jgi:tetratricopeptide (TPR) repeat protein
VHKIARGILALVVVAWCARTVSADDRARARAAFRAGSQHYNLGEFQAALDSFREAYRNFEDPSFLYNIAQCERQLGHTREAVREYRAYLNNAESAPNRDSVRETIAQLQKEIDAEDERARAAAATPVVAPPPTTVTPTTVAPPPAAALVAAPPSPVERKPAYKKWWPWTIVGGVLLAGGAATAAILLTRPNAPTAPTTLGTAHPF